jgi:ABC-type nitrate/sulfonate/bicarbonate transport system permease component
MSATVLIEAPERDEPNALGVAVGGEGERAPRRSPTALLRHFQHLGGAVLLVAVWEVVALSLLRGRHVLPTPTSVIAEAWRDGFYAAAVATTLWQAARGWLLGTALAVGCALMSLLSPRLESVLSRVGVISYCIPTVAIGPILVVLFPLDTTKVAMATLSVFFVTMVGVTTGLHAAPAAMLDYVRSCGGSRWQAMRTVRLRAAVPAAVGALALGAPASILGAMLGDYLGGTQGLGVVMLQAEESFQVSRVWAVGLVATALSGLLFGLVSLVGRLLTGDLLASDAAPVSVHAGRPDRGSATTTRQMLWLRSLVRRLGIIVLTIASVVLVWWGVVDVFRLNRYFAKTPLDVWRGIGQATTGGGWAALWSGLGTTLEDAAFGFALGLVAAGVVASLTLVRPVAAGIMPLVLVLRSVPLVAMAPLLGLLLGNGLAVVVATGAIVTFVPSVVTISGGLRATPYSSLDVFRSCGAGPVQTLWRLRVRYALPSLCAAARIAVPGAILGSVLAEWLLAGDGIGHLMAISVIGSNFDLLWAATAVVSIISLVLYQLMSDVERLATVRAAG